MKTNIQFRIRKSKNLQLNFIFYVIRWGGPFDGVLPNLTYLNLAHNELYDIPSTLLATFPMLDTLDLTGNQFIHYYPEFTSKIKAGLDMR